jgi:hypothetical protein
MELTENLTATELGNVYVGISIFALEIFIYLFLLYLIKTVCSKSANKADLQYLKRYEGICW